MYIPSGDYGSYDATAFCGNFGYRWRLGGSFSFSLGAVIGVAYELSDVGYVWESTLYRGSHQITRNYTKDIYPVAMIEACFGFDFIK